MAFEQEATRRLVGNGAVAALLLEDDIAAPDDDGGELAIDPIARSHCAQLRQLVRVHAGERDGWNPGRRACASRPADSGGGK